jgi:hypothetical protein
MGAMAVAKAAVLCERNPMRTSLFVLLLSVGFCAARERGLPPQGRHCGTLARSTTAFFAAPNPMRSASD